MTNNNSDLPKTETEMVEKFAKAGEKLGILLAMTKFTPEEIEGLLAVLKYLPPEEIEDFIELLEMKIAEAETKRLDAEFELEIREVMAEFKQKSLKLENEIMDELDKLSSDISDNK